jgi:hypothetical protein
MCGHCRCDGVDAVSELRDEHFALLEQPTAYAAPWPRVTDREPWGGWAAGGWPHPTFLTERTRA